MATINDSQLKTHAFTIRGYAYVHGITNRVELEKITTHLPTSIPFSSQYPKQVSKRDWSAPQLTSTESEKICGDKATARCLVVGLVISDNGGLDLTLRGQCRKGSVVGVKAPKNTITPNAERHVFRVVAKVEEDMNGKEPQKKLYVLLTNDRGLSYPYSVGQDSVFFFNEFRTFATSHSQRSRSWAALIRQHCFPQSNMLEIDKNLDNAGTSPVDHFRGQIDVITSSFEAGDISDLAFMEAIGELVKRRHSRFQDRPLGMLKDSADGSWEVDIDAMLDGVLAKGKELWPEVQLTNEVVDILKEGLKLFKPRIELSPMLLRGLFMESVMKHETQSPFGGLVDSQRSVEDLYEIAESIIGGGLGISKASTGERVEAMME